MFTLLKYTFILVLFVSVGDAHARRSCVQFFTSHNQTSQKKSVLSKGITSSPALRHTYEDQLREVRLTQAQDRSSVWKRVSSWFRSSKTQSEMDAKYGEQWKTTLAGDFVDATQTSLTARDLETIAPLIQEKAYIDLEANLDLTTSDISRFLDQVPNVYGLNLFMIWRSKTSALMKKIAQKQPQMRELVIDRFDNSDFYQALKLRELRVLDISNSTIGRSGPLYYLNKLFNSHLSEIAGELRYVTVEGIIEFLIATRSEVKIKGRTSTLNPHFKKIILPYLDSTEYIRIRRVAQELGITIQYQGVHRNPYFSGDYKDVSDGDSFAIMPHGVDPKRWEGSVRLAYVDAPELKVSAQQLAQESRTETEARQKVGLAARAFVYYHKKSALDELLIDTNSKDRSGRPVVINFLFVDDRWMDLAQELYLSGLAIRYEYTGQSRENNMGQDFSWAQHYKKYQALIDPWYEWHLKFEKEESKK